MSPPTSLGLPDLTMQTPGNFTGARVISFLPESLAGQLQRIIHSSDLLAVQEARLVEELSVPPRWILEFAMSLSELEGETLLSTTVPDRADSPGSPRWETGSHEGDVF